ncbi:MAG: hypothetical protein ACJAQ0_000748 [Dasania sp.]|jgi:hypothetical protein
MRILWSHISHYFIFTCIAASSAYADGTSVPINYDALSFFEEPFASDIGGATLSGNFLVDQAIGYQFENENQSNRTRLNGQARLETQLSNSWLVGVQYFGGYNHLSGDGNNDDAYNDNIAAFISDEWGTLAVGNVTGSVFEDHRLTRRVGNAVLAHNNFRGALNELGAYYNVRYNSVLLSLTTDAQGRAEAGVNFERPIGAASHFVSARVRKGDIEENEAMTGSGDTYGAAVVYGYQYASFGIDGQVGYENVSLDGSNDDINHLFSSMGLYYNYGAYSFSLDGGLGEYDNKSFETAALGMRFDLARGASFNVGVNYSNANLVDTTTAIGSLRYEF